MKNIYIKFFLENNHSFEKVYIYSNNFYYYTLIRKGLLWQKSVCEMPKEPNKTSTPTRSPNLVFNLKIWLNIVYRSQCLNQKGIAVCN